MKPSTREQIGILIGGGILGALIVLAALQPYFHSQPNFTDERIAAHNREVLAPPARPTYDWHVLEDVSFEMQPGETRSVELKNVEVAGAHIDASQGVNLKFVSPQQTCEFSAVTNARESCPFPDHWGSVYVSDARTQQAVATNGIAAMLTRNSAMAERAIAPNRVHLILSTYVCTANCPR